MEWVWITFGVLGLLALIATPLLRLLEARREAKESTGWLDIALAIAQGIDDAKKELDPSSKAKMGAALKDAAQKAGKHEDVEAFLHRFGFNKRTPE